MYSIVSTAIIQGIHAIPVFVEADVSNGMPTFEMVGFLASEVKEARERVRTAQLRLFASTKTNHGELYPGRYSQVGIRI